MPVRSRQRLSARSITSKSPGRHADGDGLLLQVTKTGSRSWLLRTNVYRKRRDIGLGGFPLVSLAEARERAAELRKIARQGGDPLAARRKQQGPSFTVAALRAHEAYKESWRNKKHAAQWLSTLQTYAFPTLGQMRVDEIRSEHMVGALGAVWLSKQETSRRVLQRIQSVLLWAKGHGFRTDNPTDEVAAARHALPKQTRQQRHHEALHYDAVPQFIETLHRAGTSDQIKLALEFLILTAARTGEVLGARWSEIDWTMQVWTIPASRMKAKREHHVPLSSRCVEILKAAQELVDDAGDYVFPGAVAGKPLSDMTLLMVIRRMGLKKTTHGFRSTFRMWCAERTSYSREVAEAALAHRLKDATEAAYMRSTFFEKRRALMADWSEFATGLPERAESPPLSLPWTEPRALSEA